MRQYNIGPSGKLVLIRYQIILTIRPKLLFSSSTKDVHGLSRQIMFKIVLLNLTQMKSVTSHTQLFLALVLAAALVVGTDGWPLSSTFG